MADKIIGIVDTKYLIRPISYKGLQRIKGLEYPEVCIKNGNFKRHFM